MVAIKKACLLRDKAKLVLEEEEEVGIRCWGQVVLGLLGPLCLNPNYQAIKK